jgi:NAD(P)H dehydrogenase (quinone)
MASKKVLILYYSGSGNTQRMAKAIGEGIRSSSTIDVKVVNVKTFDAALLPNYDGIVVGSPTYFSNVAWQVKKMIDESIVHYRDEKLKGKVAGVFTSAGTKKDGKDCLEMLEVALGHHHKMKVVDSILRVDGEIDQEVQKRCLEYGKKIAREIQN